MKPFLIMVAIVIVILTAYAFSTAGASLGTKIKSIEDPTERGCAYIAVSIFIHSLLSSMGKNNGQSPM